MAYEGSRPMADVCCISSAYFISFIEYAQCAAHGYKYTIYTYKF